MQDLDFLPAQYRQKHAQRQSQPWRIMIALIFAGLLATAAFSQHVHRLHVEEELATITITYDLALSQADKLSELQTELQSARATAELYTYLRHPWPRTQLLAALVAPMPDEVTLGQLHISHEMRQDPVRTDRRSRSKAKAEEEEIEKLPPAVRDLKRLRDQFDKMETLVQISGTTSESAALYRYLSELGNDRLFDKAGLDSIENVEGESGPSLRFDATLIVRPGYGQPHGPSGPAGKNKHSLAQAHHVSR